MNELGVENFYIELIEEYPCENIEQLRRKEGEWIRKMATLNEEIAGRTTREYYEEHIEEKKEHDKLYREENKDKRSKQAKERYERDKERIKQRVNQNYHNNREEKLVKNKEYRDNNKEKLYSKASEKFTCQCGVSYTRRNKAQHLKSMHHENDEQSLQED